MHLPGEPDAGDLALRRPDDLRDDLTCGGPPVLRALLRPTRSRRIERIGGARGGHHVRLLVDRDAPSPCRPDVKAQQELHMLSPSTGPQAAREAGTRLSRRLSVVGSFSVVTFGCLP